MEYTFHIQDPHNPDSLYIYEAIIGQIKENLISWRGIFAFATGRAVRNLFVEDPAVVSFARVGEISLVIGIDAVTDVSALEEFTRLNATYENFDAKVFFNLGAGLFHPKISQFKYKDGSSALIVGSGNLTTGGLRNNIEAYSIVEGSEQELASIAIWDEFLLRHAENIRDIDETALERARQNRAAIRAKRPKVREAEPEEAVTPAEETEEEVEASPDSRVLVARVPGAGGRWHQIHYNKDIIEQFFRITERSKQRVFLKPVNPDGTVGAEEVRPLVLSGKNRNHKIEVAARRGEDYPGTDTPPVIVLRELGLRNFTYILLMPGDSGYEEMIALTESLPQVGKGVPRVITTYRNLKDAWEECPL